MAGLDSDARKFRTAVDRKKEFFECDIRNSQLSGRPFPLAPGRPILYGEGNPPVVADSGKLRLIVAIKSSMVFSVRSAPVTPTLLRLPVRLRV